MTPTVLIADRWTGRGRDSVLRRVEAELHRAGQRFETHRADRRVGAERLAQRAAEDGCRLVVAVGGDGLVHDVVNGLVDGSAERVRGDGVALGLVAGSDGCDFSRTFGLDLPVPAAVERLLGGERFPLDVARVRCRGGEAGTRTRLFANVAEVGYWAALTRLLRWLPGPLGRLRYVLAGLAAVWRADFVPTTVQLGHTELREQLSNLVVANGQFFADGMKVAPRALPDDGEFNVQCWRMPPREAFTRLPQLRAGEHLGQGDIREYQSETVRIDAQVPLPVTADGRVLGTTPATFDLLPRIIDLAI